MNVKTEVPLKYLSNFWKTLEIPLISGEINLILTCPANCAFCEVNVVTTFTITVTNPYVPVVGLSNQDHRKLLQQLKSGSKHKAN